MNRLVSILTPCYNGEKYIRRLLDSVLSQSYPNIEMFVIDDGSTDHSAEIIKSYIPAFETKGYVLNYLFQDNAGQSVAINNGLKLISGEFLIWPDCDDFFASPKSIARMVEVLANSDDNVSMARCYAFILDENSLEEVGRLHALAQQENQRDLFEDCLFARNNYWFVPGNYIVKTKKIDELIPNREIYTEKGAGQNWQLMLPLLHKQQCITIPEYLYNVVRCSNSHSRKRHKNIEKEIDKINAYQNTLINTIHHITTISKVGKFMYEGQIEKKYDLIKYDLYLNNRRFVEARHILDNYSAIYQKMGLKYLFYHLPYAGIMAKIWNYLLRKIKLK